MAGVIAGLAVSFAALGLGIAQPASHQLADRVLAALRGASETRSENAKEIRNWKDEKARLKILHETIGQRIAQQAAHSQRAAKKLTELRKQNEGMAPKQALIQHLAALASEQAERINGSLDAFAKTVPPGVVVASPSSASDSALTRLQNALKRLEATENNLRQVAVEITTGQLDGQTIAVELLRVGGAVAWWRSLDKQQAGQAKMRKGQLILEPTASASDRQAIITACDIAKGRAAPKLVALPIELRRAAP